MRTQEEIAACCREKTAVDFNFWPNVLLCFLDYEHAREFLQPGFPADQWNTRGNTCGGEAPRHDRVLVEADIPEQLAGYMRFAWTKVRGHRGISAGLSVEKLAALAWLLGDDDVVAFAEDDRNYPQYGAPILRYLCERYGLPIPDDEGLRRMARGEPCMAYCPSGCGG